MRTQFDDFTALVETWRQPPRPLPIALAHLMANTPLSRRDRHALFNRIYSALPPVARLQLKTELAEVRRAKRDGLEAEVS